MDGFDFSAGRIHRSIDESLTRLRTTYVDLFQAHDVEFGSTDQIIEETIPALRAIQQQGKARFIGITGYSLIQLRTIATQANVDTILSYCRYNLMVSDLDTLLTPFARDRGLGLINASPLHMGLLAGAVPPWHPAPAAVRETGAAVAQLCKKYGVDPAVVALRFCLDHPYITSTLVGMATTAQVSTNLKALDANLDPQLLVLINQMIAPVHDTLWPSGRPENADNPAVHESHV
jgi:L-galactose dehydrogenase